jgi:hypothetical protein
VEVDSGLREVDSKDAKFNETFSDYRERQGKLTTTLFIKPDLRAKKDASSTKIVSFDDSSVADKDNQQDVTIVSPQRRTITPRQFLIPGTHQHKEIEVRKLQPILQSLHGEHYGKPRRGQAFTELHVGLHRR